MDYVADVKDIVTKFYTTVVHDKISLQVKVGEIYAIVGPSGCGKSTLLRELVALHKPVSGSINILGYNLLDASYKQMQELRKKWGFLFQSGALFSSLSVHDNIALPLIEYTDLSSKFISKMVAYKLDLVGLKESDGPLFPSEISGGMIKKVALARALALEPRLLLLDEPTSGLDPISAREFDRLLLRLREFLSLSVIMVSHDLHSIRLTADRLAVIDDKHIVAQGSLDDIVNTHTPFINAFFDAYKDKR